MESVEHIQYDQRMIQAFYRLRQPVQVLRFLDIHHDLPELLLEAIPYLELTFGPFPRIELEVVRDPELEDSEKLFAYILTSLPIEEALRRLDRLDEEWFLAQVDQVGSQFNFNLEPV